MRKMACDEALEGWEEGFTKGAGEGGGKVGVEKDGKMEGKKASHGRKHHYEIQGMEHILW